MSGGSKRFLANFWTFKEYYVIDPILVEVKNYYIHVVKFSASASNFHKTDIAKNNSTN